MEKDHECDGQRSVSDKSHCNLSLRSCEGVRGLEERFDGVCLNEINYRRSELSEDNQQEACNKEFIFIAHLESIYVSKNKNI